MRRHLPMIDFSGVGMACAGTPAWDAVQEQVMPALEFHGCFEAVYNRVASELRLSLLGIAKDLLSLPLQTKLRNASDVPYGGYLGHFPGLAYESLAIRDATLPHAIPNFASLMWPSGSNPNFCEKARSFTKQVAELEEMVRRMVLESLGVAKYAEEQMQSTYYLLRFTEYGAAGEWEEEKRKLAHMAHRDTNMLSIVCQLNEVDGLQVEAMDGEWHLAAPRSVASFFVIAGETFHAWSNGRVYAPMHGVAMDGTVARYSAILFSRPMSEQTIQAPAELVDGDRPSLFRPFEYGDFLHFCVSAEGRKLKKCRLSAYRRKEDITKEDEA
ncbi:unnamed protein product [Musa acuminata subsp. burmannicoides]